MVSKQKILWFYARRNTLLYCSLNKSFFAAREHISTSLAWKDTKYKLRRGRVKAAKEGSSDGCHYNKSATISENYSCLELLSRDARNSSSMYWQHAKVHWNFNKCQRWSNKILNIRLVSLNDNILVKNIKKRFNLTGSVFINHKYSNYHNFYNL